MITFIMQWWVLPATGVLAILHICYMIVDRSWNPDYDAETIKETALLTTIWPLGSAVVILILYLAIRDVISEWASKRVGK